MARIVVGVDGSTHSTAALRWAVDEARLRGAALQVVQAWELPAAFAVEFVGAPAFRDAATEIERAHASSLRRAIDALGDATEGLAIEQILLQEDPASALLRTARGADVLVVGSRGLGTVRRLVLGSVSSKCVAHAPCPVAVISAAPAERTPAEGRLTGSRA